jgi:hypothetical protein
LWKSFRIASHAPVAPVAAAAVPLPPWLPLPSWLAPSLPPRLAVVDVDVAST